MHDIQEQRKQQIEVEIEITLAAFEEGEVTLDFLETASCNPKLEAWQRAAYLSCWVILSK